MKAGIITATTGLLLLLVALPTHSLEQQEVGATADFVETDVIPPSAESRHITDVQILDIVAELVESFNDLNEKVDELAARNQELEQNYEKLRSASKDLLYERFVELYGDGADYDTIELEYGDMEEERSSVDDPLWYLLNSAEAGHPSGQLQLGLLYDSGSPGLNQSYEMAFAWYLKAAMQNLPEAQCYVGMAYNVGRGVNQSDVLSVQWYRLAAEQEDSIAQNNLGWMLLTGGKSLKEVTEQEEKEAVEWFRRSAAHGEPFGLANLGVCYTIGAGGIDPDYDMALKLYREIDKQDIQRYGSVALSESPVWRSNMMKWFEIAADEGEKLAITILKIHNVTDTSGEAYINRKTNAEQSL